MACFSTLQYFWEEDEMYMSFYLRPLSLVALAS
jgi:hypothetical protein